MFAPWKQSYDQLRQRIKKQWHYFANRGPPSQSYGFSSSHVWIWELAHKEVWAVKNWHFQIMGLESTLESPLNCKESKAVNSKEVNPEYSLEADAEAPILWQLDEKSLLLGKDPDAGKDWRQEEKRGEDKEVGWLPDSVDLSMSELWEMVTGREARRPVVHGVTESQPRLSDWIQLLSCWFGREIKWSHRL